MRDTNKSVIETLIAIDSQRIPATRLRGLKPAVLRFCFSKHLAADYAGFGVLLTPEGVAAVQAVKPEWKSVERARALALSAA